MGGVVTIVIQALLHRRERRNLLRFWRLELLRLATEQERQDGLINQESDLKSAACVVVFLHAMREVRRRTQDRETELHVMRFNVSRLIVDVLHTLYLFNAYEENMRLMEETLPEATVAILPFVRETSKTLAERTTKALNSVKDELRPFWSKKSPKTERGAPGSDG